MQWSSIIWIILALWALGVIFSYNRLIILRNRVENAWAQIDVQLKRRYDLIPNLVKTVQAYAKHEREVFQRVTEARTKAIQAGSVKEQEKAENDLTRCIKGLFAVAENYPDLKANKNFLLLQEELAGTESKIAFARQFYNDSVMSLNTRIEVFPHNILARFFGFKKQDYLEIEGLERDPAAVRFSR